MSFYELETQQKIARRFSPDQLTNAIRNQLLSEIPIADGYDYYIGPWGVGTYGMGDPLSPERQIAFFVTESEENDPHRNAVIEGCRQALEKLPAIVSAILVRTDESRLEGLKLVCHGQAYLIGLQTFGNQRCIGDFLPTTIKKTLTQLLSLSVEGDATEIIGVCYQGLAACLRCGEDVGFLLRNLSHSNYAVATASFDQLVDISPSGLNESGWLATQWKKNLQTPDEHTAYPLLVSRTNQLLRGANNSNVLTNILDALTEETRPAFFAACLQEHRDAPLLALAIKDIIRDSDRDAIPERIDELYKDMATSIDYYEACLALGTHEAIRKAWNKLTVVLDEVRCNETAIALGPPDFIQYPGRGYPSDIDTQFARRAAKMFGSLAEMRPDDHFFNEYSAKIGGSATLKLYALMKPHMMEYRDSLPSAFSAIVEAAQKSPARPSRQKAAGDTGAVKPGNPPEVA